MNPSSYDKKKTVILIGFVVFTLLLIGLGLLAINSALNKNPYGEVVDIKGYDQKITDLPVEYRQLFFSVLHTMVDLNYSGSENVDGISDAVIREGSNKETVSTDTDHAGSFIVDIPSIKQSYLAQYEYTSDVTSDFQSGYPVLLSCLDPEELIFGDFDCKEMYSQGFAEPDPILSVLPYENLSYRIRAVVDSSNTTSLVVDVFISNANEGNETALIEEAKKEVPLWLSSKNFNVDDYTVTYTPVYL
jgi:hypothetical protein